MKVPFLDLKAHHAPLIDQFDRAISLPMFPELTEEQTEHVAKCVSETVGVEALV